MPKKFQYIIDYDVHFECQLSSRQCTSKAKTGARCKRRCVIGLPCCWMHLASDHHLKIKRSLIPNTNMSGLFAWSPKSPANEPVFEKGDQIIVYDGETLTAKQRDERYSEFTAPYAMEINRNKIVDAACQRSTAALINHAKSSACNCKFSLYAKGGVVNIKAIKNIMHDTELLVNYGKEYQMDEEGVSHRTR